MRLLLVLSILIALVACDTGGEWSEGDYSVYWIDTSQNRQLGFDVGDGAYIGRVGGEVIGIGSNAVYVSAQRINHELNEIEYFYIEKSKDHKFLNGSEISVGPINEQLFIQISKDLSLPPISVKFK